MAQREAAAEARKERMLAGETEQPGISSLNPIFNMFRSNCIMNSERLMSSHAAEALSWKPRSNWESCQRPKERSVQPLADMCVNVIADYVDCVESLVGLPQIYVVCFLLDSKARMF